MARIRGFGRALTVELVEITPELAERWLGLNTHNRRSRDRKITQYAHDMRNGRWDINGETIIFAAGSNRLLDGQNRLYAVVEAETPIVSLVVRGVDDRAQETMDSGAARTLADVLRLSKEPNAMVMATTLRKLVAYTKTGVPYGPRYTTSVKQAISLLHAYPELRVSVSRSTNKGYGSNVIQKTDISTLHFLFSKVDEEMADEFFNRIGNGTNLKTFDPVHKLRERMLRERLSGGIRLTPLQQIALIIKSFNAFYSGDEIMNLVWRAKDSFPRIAGVDNVLALDASEN